MTWLDLPETGVYKFTATVSTIHRSESVTGRYAGDLEGCRAEAEETLGRLARDVLS